MDSQRFFNLKFKIKNLKRQLKFKTATCLLVPLVGAEYFPPAYTHENLVYGGM